MTDTDFSQNMANSLLANGDAINTLYDRAKKMMWSMVEYKDMQMLYTCALKEIETKFEILRTEFGIKHKRNPINTISTRLKRTESIAQKLIKNGFPISVDSIEKNINDVAGIRVVCSYIDDIYFIADALLRQDDIKLITRKDYIENPKPNGYRSLHLIVTVPVFLADERREVKVEVQIRTIAMDFWASLEHQLKYKKEVQGEEALYKQLRECADVIAETDEKMLKIREKIELAEDVPSEEELLLERLRRLDIPLV